MPLVLRVGLTGGIGAGKSTVARALATLGAIVIDADVLARRVLDPGTPGLADVVATFGERVLALDGSLDRAALARVAFSDESARRRLNAITHPRVAELTEREVAAAAPDAVVVHDVPLLVENGLGPDYHLVVVVVAPVDERVHRLVADRGMTSEQARARMRAQASDEQRAAAADVLLDNAGPPVAVGAQVERLWHGRLLPFEANLRIGRPAPREGRAVLVEPDPSWPSQAARVMARIRRVSGDRALRIDHIGSTSVPGLVAQDVIDVQVVVGDLELARRVARDLRDAGLVRRPGRWWDRDPDGSRLPKAFAQNADPARAVDCHVRPVASPAWRDGLLLRDWLRNVPAAAAAYAALKRTLADEPHTTIDAYATGRMPWIRAELGRAGEWARGQGSTGGETAGGDGGDRQE